jgi:chorismate mutase
MILNDRRRQMDELDRELIRLLNRRAQMSIELGKIKCDMGLPLRDDAREYDIIMRAISLNSGPLDTLAIDSIFYHILKESRRITAEILAKSDKN